MWLIAQDSILGFYAHRVKPLIYLLISLPLLVVLGASSIPDLKRHSVRYVFIYSAMEIDS